MPRDEIRIAALKRERAGYLARGLEERAKLVDDELRRYGAEPELPKDRTGPPKETAGGERRGPGRPRKTTDN